MAATGDGLIAASERADDRIVALRRHVPVIGVITGMLGCLGRMSITVGLCGCLAGAARNGPAMRRLWRRGETQ
jgi:hypothetical protein